MLREFQQKLKTDVYNEWDNGARVVMPVAPTGSGKTVVLSSIIHDVGGYSVAIAHRQELVSQISAAIARDGVRHRIITNNKTLIRTIAAIHMIEFGRSYIDQNSRVAVGGVDTLSRMSADDPIFAQSDLTAIDEGHHVLRDNKWGKVWAKFRKARGLFPSATPSRADGMGLGSHADGVVDALVLAPGMRDIINMGYLTDYKIFCPPSNLKIDDIPVGANGDFVAKQLSDRVSESSIVGDVVSSYLKIAKGKLGVTFAVDIKEADRITRAYQAAGIPAQLVTSETPDEMRASIGRKFKNREILQLVNVDLFGEGYDLPALEVVSFARPTASFPLYCLDPETEVLTPSGWKNVWDIENINEVCAFDTVDNSVKTVSVSDKIKRDLYPQEVMFGISSPHLDIAVSDKHDMIIKSKNAPDWKKEKAEKVASRKSLFRLPVAGFGDYKGADLSNSDLRFLGWFLSDGTINKKTNALMIAQSINKTKHIDSILSCITECKFKCGIHIQKRKNCPDTHNDLVRISISKGAPRGTMKNLTGWGRLEKWLDKTIPECYNDLTREQLLILLETLNLGDGVNNHDSLGYDKKSLTITCGDNRVMADRIQALCVTRGLRCNKKITKYEWHILHIKDVQTSTIAGVNVGDGDILGKSYKRSRFEKLEYRPEFVWCLTNKLGTLITRRNGKVAIVGNCQQFGRVLRLFLPPEHAPHWHTYSDHQRLAIIAASSKPHGIVIDHVSNVIRHMGPPDRPVAWSLDRRDKRSASKSDAIPYRVCPQCAQPYERIHRECPFCGYYAPPASRSSPAHVDGDLCELDPAILRALRGEVARIDGMFYPPDGLSLPATMGARARHYERQEAQKALRNSIAWWAGLEQLQGRSESESYRRFYFKFGIDVATCQTLGRPDAHELALRINVELAKLGIDGTVNHEEYIK